MFFLCLPRERTKEKGPGNKPILLFFRLIDSLRWRSDAAEMGKKTECQNEKNIADYSF